MFQQNKYDSVFFSLKEAIMYLNDKKDSLCWRIDFFPHKLKDRINDLLFTYTNI